MRPCMHMQNVLLLSKRKICPADLMGHAGVKNTYNLGQKVLRILLFLTHRRPTLRIWHHGDPSPHPSLVNVV